MRVDFTIIGAQKCGTTSLAFLLAQHPGICFSKEKEPGYFNKVDDWEIGLEGYHKLFSPENGQICGEASTMYTFLPEWQDTHSKLYAYNPEMKLIYIMRNPVERIISNYAHDLVRGIVRGKPEDAIFRHPFYVNRSRYHLQIRPYLERFPRENVLLLVFDEFISDQKRSLEQIAGFLGLEMSGFEDVEAAEEHKTLNNWYLKYDVVRKVANTSLFQTVRPHIPSGIRKPIRRFLSDRLQIKPSVSKETRRTIWRLVEEDVRGIEKILERTLDSWYPGDWV